eukprot:3082162-Alexandrium_andersonii.AAC.1
MPVVSAVLSSWDEVFLFILSMHNHAGFSRAATERTSFAGHNQWDPVLAIRAAKKMDARDKGLLRAVWGGALWSPKHAFRAGFAASARCWRCGCDEADLVHILWTCPAGDQRRAECLAACGVEDYQELPMCLRMHGIAPAIGLGEGMPWLGGQSVFPECLQQLCAPREVADVSLSCLGRFLRGAPIAGEQP